MAMKIAGTESAPDEAVALRELFDTLLLWQTRIKLDAQGNLVCGATYGGSDGQEADAIAVARFATGSGQDTAMFGGTHYGVMSIGPSSLSTGTLSVVHGYVASIHANSF